MTGSAIVSGRERCRGPAVMLTEATVPDAVPTGARSRPRSGQMASDECVWDASLAELCLVSRDCRMIV